MSQNCAPIALGNACCPDRETRIFCSVKHNQVFQLSLILNCTFCLAHMFMWNVGQFFLFSCYFGYLRTIYRFTQCRLPLDNVGAWAVVGNTGVWRHFKIYWSLQLVPNGLGWKIFFFKKGGWGGCPFHEPHETCICSCFALGQKLHLLWFFFPLEKKHKKVPALTNSGVVRERKDLASSL